MAKNRLVIGTNKRDAIWTWRGDDVIKARAGNDLIESGAGRDWIFGGKGNDLIYSGAGRDWVFGGSGQDRIFAGRGNDIIDGGKGRDIIFAGRGNDRIIGGDGNDIIRGGRGTDTAVYTGDALDHSISSGNGGLRVVDRDSGDADRLFGVEKLKFDDVTLYLDGRDNAPLADDVAITINEDDPAIPLDLLALADAFDIDGDPLTLVSVETSPRLGFDPLTGAVSYDVGNAFDALTAGETATEAFDFVLTDGTTQLARTLTVTIEGRNTRPEAEADSEAATENGAIVAVDVLANDRDPDSDDTAATLKVVAASAASGAVVTFTGLPGAGIAYDPDGVAAFEALAAGETTTDTVTYTIEDRHGARATATVAVTVTGVNDKPQAKPDTAAATENGSIVAIDVLANDSDPDSDDFAATLKVVAASATSGATVGFTGLPGAGITYDTDGVATFEALAVDETTTDTITYTIEDRHGAEATATVDVTVTGVNDKPQAKPDAAAATENGPIVAIDVLADDSDADSDDSAATLKVVAASAASGAVVTFTGLPGAGIAYNPDGVASFETMAAGETTTDVITYTIEDRHGAQATTTVGMTVTGVNDEPAGLPVILGTIAEDSPLTADPTDITDADGPGPFQYQWQVSANGADGWTDIATATTADFTPGDDEVGQFLRVVVSYDDGGTAESVASDPTVAVINIDDPPTGLPVIIGTPEVGTELGVDLSPVSDADGALTATAYQWLADGETIDTATEATFVPTLDQAGKVITVRVTVGDPRGGIADVTSVSGDPIPPLDTGVVHLADLDGSDGFVINGIDSNENSPEWTGFAVDHAGDINGDGFADLVLGAPGTITPGAFLRAGAVYVVFGGANLAPGGSLELAALDGSNGFSIPMFEPLGLLGDSVSGAGDVNDDGLDDIIISAPLRQSGPNDIGTAWVIYGTADGFDASFSLSLSVFTADDASEFFGGADFRAGQAVNSAGDVDGDGIDDFLIGAPGADDVFLVFGTPNPARDLSLINAGFQDGSLGILLAGATNSETGRTDTAGDFNGDGFADVIVSDENGSDTAYLVFGGSTIRAGGNIDLTALGSSGVAITGFGATNQVLAVGAAGDVNRDGRADVIIGVPDAPDGGRAYVIYGNARDGDIDVTDIDDGKSSVGFAIAGIDDGDQAGFSVSGAGDVNGDGFDDLLVGAPAADGAGAAYLIFGAPAGRTLVDLANLDPADGFAIAGIDPDDQAGHAVSSAGDVNGDGFDDIFVGAPGQTTNALVGTTVGEAYVLYGRDFLGVVDQQGTLGSDTLNASDAGEILLGANGDDTLNGGAGDDLLKGGNGDDVLVSRAGIDRAYGGNGADTFVFEFQPAPTFNLIMDFTPGEDVIWVRGSSDGFGDLDTNGDGVIDTNDPTNFGTPLLLNLGGGNGLFVVGASQLTPADLVFV